MECLVTKLKGTVDADFLKLNEVRLTFEPTGITGISAITLGAANDKVVTLKIIGDGNFTYANGAVIGKTTTGAGLIFTVYVTDDVRVISIDNKQNVFRYGSNSATSIVVNPSGGTPSLRCNIDLDSIAYSTNLFRSIFLNTSVSGNLSVFKTIPQITMLYVNSPNVYGDIALFKDITTLTDLYISDSTRITGDVDNLSKLIDLTALSLSSTGVSGNIAAFANMTKLVSVNLTNAHGLTGDISAFARMSQMTIAPYLDNISGISGDLASLPNNMRYISNGGGCSFTWSKKGARTNVLACNGIKFVSGADQFLIDMATCNLNPAGSSDNYKTLRLFADVTSASTTAIATLQAKGVTVIITPLT